MQSIRNYHLLKGEKEKASVAKKLFFNLIPLWLCRTITEATMKLFSCFKTKYINQLSHRGRSWPLFERTDIEDLIEGDFCGKKYPIPRNSDKILTQCYGDYMTLPPINQMQPTHNIIECDLGSE